MEVTEGVLDFAPPVCRYFLTSGCYRSDCKFSHDATATTCRFWALGECAKGSTCPFRHAFEDDSSIAEYHSKSMSAPVASSAPAPTPVPPPPTVRSVPPYCPRSHMPLSIADKLKIKQLTEKYSHGIAPSIIEDIFLHRASRNIIVCFPPSICLFFFLG